MLDYVLVNQRFRSSILDTSVYRKTHLQSDHRLVISKVRLKLKAKRRAHAEGAEAPGGPTLPGRSTGGVFRRVIAGEFQVGPTGDVQEDWCTFRDSRTVLPAISTRERGSDWVTDKVCEAARKKQEAWMR